MITPEVTLNVALLRERIPNIQSAAQATGLPAATISDLANGKTRLDAVHVGTLLRLAAYAHCSLDELIVAAHPDPESFAATIARWGAEPGIRNDLGAPEVEQPRPEAERRAMVRALPVTTVVDAGSPTPGDGFAIS